MFCSNSLSDYCFCLLFELIAIAIVKYASIAPLVPLAGEPSNSYSIVFQGAPGRALCKEELCLEQELLNKPKDHNKQSTDTLETKMPHFKPNQF